MKGMPSMLMMRNCGKMRCRGLNPESQERARVLSSQERGAKIRSGSNRLRDSGACSPGKFFYIWVSDLAGNASKPTTRYEIY